MDTPEDAPTFNLKVVVQETGIKPHTLRAWERRYGLPQPERTSAGHRLFTQRDIDIVKWLIARQEEGMNISRAVELWHSLINAGEDPLEEETPPPVEAPPTPEIGAPLGEMRRQWIEHGLRFDEAAADRVLTQAFAIYPVKMVCTEIIQKGLSYVGQLWYDNKATVQQEHFVSLLATQRFNALMAAAPQPTRIGRILTAAPSLEEHAISLLLLSLLLRYRGWEVVFLGPNVPITQMDITIDMIKPELVIMAAQRLQTASSLAEMAALLRQKGISNAYGGLIFNLNPSMRQHIASHFLGETLEEAMPNIEQLMSFKPPIPRVDPISPTYQNALDEFRVKRPLIELDIRQRLYAAKVPYEFVEATNSRLGENILAALKLGEIRYVNTEIELGRKLFINYDMPMDVQQQYFKHYAEAAAKYLNGSGTPISTWLKELEGDLYPPRE